MTGTDGKESTEIMEKTVKQAECTQQIVNHLHNYDGGVKKYTELSKDKQDNLYTILSQIL